MRGHYLAVLGFGLLIIFLSFHLVAQSGQPANEVKKAIDAWVNMWNTYDLSQVKKLFLKNERITYFSSEREGVIRGIDAIIEHHEGFGFIEGGKAQGNKLWLEDISIQSIGSVSIVTGIWFFKRSGSNNKIQKGPVTIVYLKLKKEYLIAHMHFANYKDKNNKIQKNL
jgi:ketosteroid isomerase-like protein